MALHDNVVWTAPSGRHYLSGGGHLPFAYALGVLEPPPSSFLNFTANIASRTAYCAQRGIVYRHFVFADKHTVELNQIDGQPYRPLLDRYRQTFGDMFSAPDHLLRAFGKPVFHRTDSHWNAHGQNVMALEVARALGITPGEIDRLAPVFEAGISVNPEYAGDLGKKLDPPETEDALLFRRPRHVWYSTNKISGLATDGLIYITFCASARDRTLLVFGDSFAVSMLFQLAHFFRNIILVRSRHFHPEFVEAAKPTHVISTNVERYLADVGPDSHRPFLLLAPDMKGRKTEITGEYAVHLSALLSAGYPPYYSRLGQMAVRMGKPDLAEQYFQDGLLRFPGDPMIETIAASAEQIEAARTARKKAHTAGDKVAAPVTPEAVTEDSSI